MDWMDLGTAPASVASAIDVTIGPYEVYEDGLMNLKAAFEAFVTVRDEAESRKLAQVGTLLDELEANLPLDDRHKKLLAREGVAHLGRERGLHGRRCEPRRADGRLQTSRTTSASARPRARRRSCSRT